MPITITDTDVAILSDQMMLARIQEAIQAVNLGKKYSITGSRSFENYSHAELLDMLTFYEDRVLAQKGGQGQNLSDFSGSAGEVPQ